MIWVKEQIYNINNNNTKNERKKGEMGKDEVVDMVIDQ